MRGKSVAVLDIRSYEMTAVVGERGVNGTFIIKSKYTCAYDGYAEGELLDVKGFAAAVADVVKSTLSAMGGIREFYVSVPGEFTDLVCTDRILSFQSAKRITNSDCGLLLDVSAPAEDDNWINIRRSSLYYILSDKRKVVDPIGLVSDSLQAKCCFYRVKAAFLSCVKNIFASFKDIKAVHFIPVNYAEASYLLDSETKADGAVLFDMGYISSTYSVAYGNGLLYSESFSVGIGHIAFYLMSELDIPFEVASAFLSMVNLNAKETLTSKEECIYEGKTYTYSTNDLRNLIREGLDGICETIEECRQSFSGRNIDSKPLLITGEGVKVVRGTADHISGRLEKTVEIIAPGIPYYDKPHFSSVLSVLDTAIKDSNS